MPSKTAKGLIRHLLNPKWQLRLAAAQALRHPWFRPGCNYDDTGDDLPLLELQDFEESFSDLEREFMRLATGAAQAATGAAQAVGTAAGRVGQAVTDVQIGAVDYEPPALDPHDERHVNCVVCCNSSGNLGYLCPHCHHTVCLSCLESLTRAECPHCRQEAADVAIAQRVARFARSVQQAELLDGPGGAAASVSVGLDIRSHWTDQEQQRRSSCHFCQLPSAATSHVCPICHTSTCISCTKRELASDPRCPNCGDAEQNAAALKELLAVDDAWHQATEVVTRALEALETTRMAIPACTRSTSGNVPKRDTDTATSRDMNKKDSRCSAIKDASSMPRNPNATYVRRQLVGQAQLPLQTKCHYCNCASTSLDLVCPGCNACVCIGCARARLEGSTLCPACENASFCSAQTMRLVLHAAQVQNSAHGLWNGLVGMGRELLKPNCNQAGRTGSPNSTQLMDPTMTRPKFQAERASRHILKDAAAVPEPPRQALEPARAQRDSWVTVCI